MPMSAITLRSYIKTASSFLYLSIEREIVREKEIKKSDALVIVLDLEKTEERGKTAAKSSIDARHLHETV
jgi:hypothetical protein